MAHTFTIRLADLVVKATTLYGETPLLCRDYLIDTEEAPDIVVETDQERIDCERERDNLGDFSDSYYETLAVYREIAEELPRFGRMLIHGSCVAIGERAWLFLARSGTGKSTHTRWWRTEFADQRPYMVNDDKPIVEVREDGVFIYGTPWDGKERLSSNVRVRLAGIGLLERSQTDFAKPIPASEGVVAMLPHVYRPAGRAAVQATIEAIRQVSNRVPLFRVEVTNSANAAHVVHDIMAP